ncbi:MAG: hypothetical protein ACTSP3_02015 [Candidatus Heimdallarchaeaceae archaeon]
MFFRIFLNGIYSVSLNYEETPLSSRKNLYSSLISIKKSYIPSDPIEVSSDGDFAAFSGSETADEPYIIEGFNITANAESGIEIK